MNPSLIIAIQQDVIVANATVTSRHFTGVGLPARVSL